MTVRPSVRPWSINRSVTFCFFFVSIFEHFKGRKDGWTDRHRVACTRLGAIGLVFFLFSFLNDFHFLSFVSLFRLSFLSRSFYCLGVLFPGKRYPGQLENFLNDKNSINMNYQYKGLNENNMRTKLKRTSRTSSYFGNVNLLLLFAG